jgi:penicillin-binding protein 2
VKSQATSLTPNEASASAQMKKIPIACKTGTAEFGDPQNRTHAWLTLFAPIPAQYLPASLASDPTVLSGDPEISMTVLVEEGGEGSDVAAPVAKKILESWFTR